MGESVIQVPEEAWVGLLAADPRPWLLTSGEPTAELVALTALLDRPAGDPDVRSARERVLADPGTAELIDRLPRWDCDAVTTGHNSPTFAPNLLSLLAHMGLLGGDSPVIDQMLDQMLEHQDRDGRFQTLARWRKQDKATWGSLLCDTHAITEVLVRFGHADDPRLLLSLQQIAADAVGTPDGPGWPCRPDERTGFRGPGRKGEICPQVTLEALRVFAYLPEAQRPPVIAVAAGTPVQVWLNRSERKPYMFGHGRQFKTVKWPPLWYDAYTVLETLSWYPSVWAGPEALPAHRRGVAELAACVTAYNFGDDGRVTPRSCYRGFERLSFGQKKTPSPLATALLCRVLRRLDDLTEDIMAVDVLSLSSSKGGTGIPLPPRF